MEVLIKVVKSSCAPVVIAALITSTFTAEVSAKGLSSTKTVTSTISLSTCQTLLNRKMKSSLIKRELFHISNMKQPCKKMLLGQKAKSIDASKAVARKSSTQLYSQEKLFSKFSSWGINPNITNSNINLDSAWKLFRKRKEIVVAVIDTGIDPNHPFLKDNVVVTEGNKNTKNYGKDFSFKGKQSTRTPFDQHGHGTHVAGIVKSVFPEVKILPLKYYNPQHSGQQNLDSTIRALEYAVNAGVDIINYSGGGPEPAVKELKILKEAERKGILVVAAAGNDSSNIDNKFNAYYPASYGLSNIVTVTAHNQKLATLNSSNWGQKSVDLSAPGYDINSAFPLGKATTMTGTSQATAFATGVAALIKSQYPELTAQDIKMILRSSVKKVSGLAKKCISSGILDATNALKVAKQYTDNNNQRTLAARKKRAQ